MEIRVDTYPPTPASQLTGDGYFKKIRAERDNRAKKLLGVSASWVSVSHLTPRQNADDTRVDRAKGSNLVLIPT